MQLNVKNARTHELARELAARSGVSITEAVTEALTDALAPRTKQQELTTRELREELTRIADVCADLPVLDRRTPDEIL